MRIPRQPVLWPVVGVISLAVIAIGNELESGWLMALPMVIGLFFGLTLEWAYAQVEKQEAQDIKQAAQQARLAVVAGNDAAGNEPGLQGVVDPLPHAKHQDTQTHEDARLVVNPLEINRERSQQAGRANNRKNLVPGVDLEGLQWVRHGSEHSDSKPVNPQIHAGKE